MPDRVQAAGHARDLELRADAVGAAARYRPSAMRVQPREAADALDHLGPAWLRRPGPDQRDGLRGGLEVDAGPAVGLGHDFAGCSSRNFPACSGIGIGYSPSKHAPAQVLLRRPGGRDHPLHRQVAEGVGADELAHLLDRQIRGHELGARRHVDAVEARPLDRRAGDARVDLGGARLAERLHELPRRRAAHDRVVDDHEALAADHVGDRVQLQLHPALAQRLLGWMKVRPTYRFFINPSPYGMPETSA